MKALPPRAGDLGDVTVPRGRSSTSVGRAVHNYTCVIRPDERVGNVTANVEMVVDVANVVGSTPNGWWKDRLGATTRTLAWLAPLMGRLTPHGRITRVTVVVEGRARNVEAPADLTVLRAAQGQTGDDVISGYVAAGGRPMLVVTADRGLRARLPRDVEVAGPRLLHNLRDSVRHLAAVRVLEEAAVRYRLHEHEAAPTGAEAHALTGFPLETSVKTLAFTISDDSLVLAGIPGDARLSYGALAKALNISRSALAPADADVLRAVGMEPGGICPFSADDSTIVVLDAAIRRFNVVYCGSGSPSFTVEVSAEGFYTACGDASVASIAAR